MIKVNYNNANITKDELKILEPLAYRAFDTLVNQSGAGNNFLGWLKWPNNYDKAEYARLKLASHQINEQSDVLVVIGIGGSYLGAKALLEALKPYFTDKKNLEIIFAGHTLSSTYAHELLAYLENKRFSINVISKSGTTTEPALLFRLLKAQLTKQCPNEVNSRIYATTDKNQGALITEARAVGYQTFVVPEDIGGRYSVFTAVGLLPLMCAGIDVDNLMDGARQAMEDCYNRSFEHNQALIYASLRHQLYQIKQIEALVTYEPKLSYLSEWWKQLFGESEGKDYKGLFPASLVYSTDLHSLGQYIQEGQRTMFETVINIVKPEQDIMLEMACSDLDGMNYLAGKTLDEVNKKAMEGTILAHVDGFVPNIVLDLPHIDANSIGYLLYFFMFSCGVSCYMLDVNPFNQPGVESYKQNMFALLGKKGYEALGETLVKRLNK